MERSYGKGCVWVMYKIGVIGEGDGILGFLAAGFSVYPVASAAQAAERLHALAKENFAVLFITEELAEKIKALRAEIDKQSSQSMTTDMFISLVRKYTRARKLTPRMLNELVEKIEVYNAEKIDGEWVQRLRIHYNCVGEMNIPNEPALPIPAVTVNTRKGVFVSYTTDDRPAV